MIPATEQRVKEQRFRLNPQGLARKDRELMEAIGAPSGCILGSADLASGEPTCTTHYSGDKNYADATFNMVGKEPFYAKDGLLKIDNLYLTVMSTSPMGKVLAKELFHTRYGTETFAEKWLQDSPMPGKDGKTVGFRDWLTKGQIKAEYAFHKIGTLGLGYAMGAKKFQNVAYDNGHVISFGQAKEFFASYWANFPDIKKFANVCAWNLEKKGYLVNEFGYRLMPDSPHKAFNYWIQSTVSGIMHVLCSLFFDLAPYCKFLLVIHDEIIFSCPAELQEKAKAAMKEAERQLNALLKWRVNIRVGFAVGNNLFEAK